MVCTHSLTPLYLEVVNLAFFCTFSTLIFSRSVRSARTSFPLPAFPRSTCDASGCTAPPQVLTVVVAVAATGLATSELTTGCLAILLVQGPTAVAAVAVVSLAGLKAVADLTSVEMAVAERFTCEDCGMVAELALTAAVVADGVLLGVTLAAVGLTEVESVIAGVINGRSAGGAALKVILAAAGRIVEMAGVEERASCVLLMRVWAASSCFMLDSVVLLVLLPRAFSVGAVPCGGLCITAVPGACT